MVKGCQRNPPQPEGAKGVSFRRQTSNRSALALGGPLLAGKMHGTLKHCNVQHFWAQAASPSFLS